LNAQLIVSRWAFVEFSDVCEIEAAFARLIESAARPAVQIDGPPAIGQSVVKARADVIE
jgi:hypothetical protein